jgi:hypothetical protein
VLYNTLLKVIILKLRIFQFILHLKFFLFEKLAPTFALINFHDFKFEAISDFLELLFLFPDAVLELFALLLGVLLDVILLIHESEYVPLFFSHLLNHLDIIFT